MANALCQQWATGYLQSQPLRQSLTGSMQVSNTCNTCTCKHRFSRLTSSVRHFLMSGLCSLLAMGDATTLTAPAAEPDSLHAGVCLSKLAGTCPAPVSSTVLLTSADTLIPPFRCASGSVWWPASCCPRLHGRRPCQSPPSSKCSPLLHLPTCFRPPPRSQGPANSHPHLCDQGALHFTLSSKGSPSQSCRHPDALPSLFQGLPEGLRHVIHTCMAEEPAKRPRTAVELVRSCPWLRDEQAQQQQQAVISTGLNSNLGSILNSNSSVASAEFGDWQPPAPGWAMCWGGQLVEWSGA